MVTTTFLSSSADLAIVLILCSAFCHATANAIIKSTHHKTACIVITIVTRACMMSPFLFLFPLPQGMQWFWIMLSASIHICYNSMLAKSYAIGDFSLVYPIARGATPVFTAFGAVLFLGETMTLNDLVGILTISCGLLIFASETKINKETGLRRVSLSTILYTMGTSICVVLYTLVDAYTVRNMSSVFSFMAWYSLFTMSGMVLVGMRVCGGFSCLVNQVFENKYRPVIASFIWTLSYILALYAIKIWDLSQLAALRETSILIGALIGVFIFKETMGKRRILAALIIVAGAIWIKAT